MLYEVAVLFLPQPGSPLGFLLSRKELVRLARGTGSPITLQVVPPSLGKQFPCYVPCTMYYALRTTYYVLCTFDIYIVEIYTVEIHDIVKISKIVIRARWLSG